MDRLHATLHVCAVRAPTHNVPRQLKYTPLHWAIHFGCLEEEVRLKRVEKLLKAGANKNVKNQIGNTPMDYAGSQYNEYKTIMQVLQ